MTNFYVRATRKYPDGYRTIYGGYADARTATLAAAILCGHIVNNDIAGMTITGQHYPVSSLDDLNIVSLDVERVMRQIFTLSPDACTREHRPPEGPNEDSAVCLACGTPTFELRPEDETYGDHLPDCSLERRHFGKCVPGGNGHPRADVIRGYWPGCE